MQWKPTSPYRRNKMNKRTKQHLEKSRKDINYSPITWNLV